MASASSVAGWAVLGLEVVGDAAVLATLVTCGLVTVGQAALILGGAGLAIFALAGVGLWRRSLGLQLPWLVVTVALLVVAEVQLIRTTINYPYGAYWLITLFVFLWRLCIFFAALFNALLAFEEDKEAKGAKKPIIEFV